MSDSTEINANILQLNTEAELKAILEKYYIPLFYYARKIISDKETAEEIVQDSFVKLWQLRKKNKYTNTTLVPYLYKTVYNSCLDYFRHKGVVDKFNEYYSNKIKEAEAYSNVSQDSGLSILIANEMRDDIREAIDKLPPRCKQIFELKKLEGLSQKEIAEKLNISVNTVEKQLSRAMTKLRQSLKKHISYLHIFLA